MIYEYIALLLLDTIKPIKPFFDRAKLKLFYGIIMIIVVHKQ